MHDLIIVGAGPAGLSAAIYASWLKLDYLVIGKLLGGVVTKAHDIKNYPGFKTISGNDLANTLYEHAKDLGANILFDNVKEIKKLDQGFEIITNKEKYQAKNLILALGTERKKLNVKGEDKFLGKGVSYCAVCDANFFKKKNVAVVGGGESALDATNILTNIANKVYLICKDEKFKFNENELKILEDKGVNLMLSKKIKEIKGNKKVEKILLDSEELEVDGVFIEIGSVPNIVLLNRLGIDVDKNGFVKVDKNQKTNVDNIYAAGDLVENDFKQIISAAYQGSLAVYRIKKELNK